MANPSQAIAAWSEMGEMPPEAQAALLGLLEDFDESKAREALPVLANIEDGSEDAVVSRLAFLVNEDPKRERRPVEIYEDFLKSKKRRPYAPELPEAAVWAADLYGGLGKDAEARTLRSEMVAALDLYGVQDDCARLEQVSYWGAMDEAVRKYRGDVMDAELDKRLRDAT